MNTFNSLFSRTVKQEMMGVVVDHMQHICTLLETRHYARTPSASFYLHALLGTHPASGVTALKAT